MKKERILLYIGVCLPLLLVLGIAGFVLLTPSLSDPAQDFLFTSEDSDICTTYKNHLVVSTVGGLRKESNMTRNKEINDAISRVDDSYSPCQNRARFEKEIADVYRYDFKTKIIQKIEEKELLNYKIQAGTSPDGYNVGFSASTQQVYGPEIFIGNSPESLYLKKGVLHKKLITESFASMVKPYNFQIIGWIVSNN
jgi:hypothetical protein